MSPWGTHPIPKTWQLGWTNWLLLVPDLPQQMLKEEQEEPLRWWTRCWSPLASESGQCRLPWCGGRPSFLLWEVAASVPFPHLPRAQISQSCAIAALGAVLSGRSILGHGEAAPVLRPYAGTVPPLAAPPSPRQLSSPARAGGDGPSSSRAEVAFSTLPVTGRCRIPARQTSF